MASKKVMWILRIVFAVFVGMAAGGLFIIFSPASFTLKTHGLYAFAFFSILACLCGIGYWDEIKGGGQVDLKKGK